MLADCKYDPRLVLKLRVSMLQGLGACMASNVTWRGQCADRLLLVRCAGVALGYSMSYVTEEHRFSQGAMASQGGVFSMHRAVLYDCFETVRGAGMLVA
jgi:hypothetical protein